VHATPFGPVFSVKTIEGTDYKRQTPHLGKLRFQMTVYWSDAKLPAIVIQPAFHALHSGAQIRAFMRTELLDYLTP
jgi:hypothetical protein